MHPTLHVFWYLLDESLLDFFVVILEFLVPGSLDDVVVRCCRDGTPETRGNVCIFLLLLLLLIPFQALFLVVALCTGPLVFPALGPSELVPVSMPREWSLPSPLGTCMSGIAMQLCSDDRDFIIKAIVRDSNARTVSLII